MTDKRMEYMQDALGYIEDSYIEEAAEALGHARRKKEQKRKIKVRILQVAAVLVLCWGIVGMLKTAGFLGNGAVKETMADKGEADGDMPLYYVPFAYQSETMAGVPSQGEAEVPDDGTSIGTTDKLTAEAIFAQDIAIFRGTVDDMDYYKGTGIAETYFAVLYIGVSECYQGDLEEGDVCRIFIPLIPGYSTSSLAGNLDQLSLGSEAIFMPNISGPEDRFDLEEGSLVYEELADYYFTDGQHYLFLEKNGKMFCDDTFGIAPEGEYVVMDDVASYIKEMLKK